jgi:excinuclease ABC subunit A
VIADEHVLSAHRAKPRCAVEGGGEIVAEGTPEQVAQEPRSYTGHYLAPLLQGSRAEVVAAPVRKKRAKPASVREREAAE